MTEAANEGHPTARLEMLELLVEANDSDAQALLAIDLFEGTNNIKKDGKRAIELFRQAARGGSGIACYYLSKAYENGNYVLQDRQRAISLLKESAKLKYAQGMSDLADNEKQNGNKEDALSLYKEILLLEETNENIRGIKHAIAQIVNTLIPSKGAHFDVDANTLGLCSLVFDYVRLDSSIVTSHNLNEMLEKAQNLDTSSINHLSIYYEIESRGPMAMGTIPGSKIWQEDRTRAYDMQIIHQSFELINIALHIIKLSKGETNSIYDLAVSYFNGGNYAKAKAYTDLGIKLEIPSVLGYINKVWDKLDYDEWFAKKCLEKAAKLGSKTAKLDIEYNQMLENSEHERKEYVQKVLKDEEEARETLKRIGFDLLERDIDIMFGGSGHNIDEKALLGELSFTEASYLRHLRRKILEK